MITQTLRGYTTLILSSSRVGSLLEVSVCVSLSLALYNLEPGSFSMCYGVRIWLMLTSTEIANNSDISNRLCLSRWTQRYVQADCR